VLTPDAVDFLSRLHREFEPRRQEILAATDRYVEELAAEVGAPSAEETDRAGRMAGEIASRRVRAKAD